MRPELPCKDIIIQKIFIHKAKKKTDDKFA